MSGKPPTLFQVRQSVQLLNSMAPYERLICLSAWKRILDAVTEVAHAPDILVQTLIDHNWETSVTGYVEGRRATNVIRLTVSVLSCYTHIYFLCKTIRNKMIKIIF